MELFVMISVQKQHDPRGGVEYSHQAVTITAEPGATRIGALKWAIEQLPERMRDGSITFFSAEPNTIDVPATVKPEPEPVPAKA